jgi:hypothetical protein
MSLSPGARQAKGQNDGVSECSEGDGRMRRRKYMYDINALDRQTVGSNPGCLESRRFTFRRTLNIHVCFNNIWPGYRLLLAA